MKKKILSSLLLTAMIITTTTNAQVGIGVSTANINPSAQLDVTSITKGFLPPRMTTTQRDAISTPATGLVIFNTTTNSLEYRSSTSWVQLTTGGVPYTGATGAVDLGNYNLTVNGITVGLGGATAGTNTAIGYLAQSAANGGQGHNTAIGAYSLQANAGGYNNTAVGDQALNTLQTGHENSAFGKWSLQYSNGSNYNSGIGFSALRNNTSGNYNTGLGTEAGLANTTGTNNTFLGYGANSNSGSLTNATAIGNWAIVAASNSIQLGNLNITNVKTSGTITAGTITYPNTDGTANQVLSTNGSGVVSWATASSGVSSIGTIDGSSTANGASISGNVLSLAPADGTNGGIVTASAQTFSGNKTFNANIIVNGVTIGALGPYNTVMGASAFPNNNQGFLNTAIGYQSMYNQTNGKQSTAVGPYALYSQTGFTYYNTAVGESALYGVTSGNENTGIGDNAGAGITSGSQNTFLGSGSGASGNFSNATAIGCNASAGANNSVRIGNTSVTSIGGQVGWTTASDIRLKKNITNSKYGLATVMKLRPVDYNLISSDLPQVGFIAQEVKKLVPEVINGKEGDLSKGETLGITYGNLVPVLTKAIQEQQAQISLQQKEIDDLKKMVEQLLNKK